LTATGKAPQQLHPQLALLVTTSGSTGSPKLVRLSQQNLQSNATSISEYLALDETEKPLVHLPLNYVFGLSVVNSHLLVGATLILTRYGLMQ
ncbi:AMP-binding protein, partial [Mycobacterium tuberculosis]